MGQLAIVFPGQSVSFASMPLEGVSMISDCAELEEALPVLEDHERGR